MFESETEQMTEQRRSRMLMILGGIGALALAIVIVFLSRGTRSTTPPPPSTALPGGAQQRLDNALRVGTPEFDAYKAKVTLEPIDKIAASNVLGMTQLALDARLTNQGDRTLSGVEIALRAFSYEEEGKVLAMNYGLPIPQQTQRTQTWGIYANYGQSGFTFEHLGSASQRHCARNYRAKVSINPLPPNGASESDSVPQIHHR
jgi:hypothetical protein